MSSDIGSETTTHVPLLKYDEEDSLVGRDDGMADNDSLEGHVITVVRPSHRSNFADLVKKPIFWLCLLLCILLIICIILGVLLAGAKRANSNTQQKLKDAEEVCLTAGCLDSAHYINNAMNTTADPCEDFFQYACGGWIKKNPIPDSGSFWGTFSDLWDQNMQTLKRLLKNTEKSTSTAIELAKTFYDSCMNIDKLNELKATPLHEIIKEIGGWSISKNSTGVIWSEKKFNFSETLKKIHINFRTSVFFSFHVDADDKNSLKNIIKIDQDGLGIERSYYLENITDKNLVAYHNYMTTVGVLLGGERKLVGRQMMDVLHFEQQLAKIFLPPDNRSQIDQVYRKMTIKELSRISPKIPWLDFLSAAFHGITTIKESENIVVFAKDYLSKLAAVLNKANKTVLNNYMIWQVVNSKVPSLSAEFREASERKHKVLEGTTTTEERWKICISETDETVGMALGNLFVKEKFQGSSKQQATEMIDAIRNAFKKRLPLLDWMDDKTRKAAIEKADAVVDMIGFPEYIHDYSKLDEKYKGLEFLATKFFDNQMNSIEFSSLKNIKNLIKGVEKSKWLMTPQTVNAYYSPSRNQIVFPAGILQAPYFDMRFPKYCNYGSIGGAVGHELVHAFDNSGRMYDKEGNFGVQWWTNKSIEGFQKKANCLIEEYNQFSYYGEHVNGKFTLGENIADNGGLKASYSAYKEWVKKNGPEQTLPVLQKTNDQLFFIAYGQSWCASIRPEKAKIMLDIDPHSPNKFRVLGTLSNLQEFADAFNCPVGSKMNPKTKCVIW